MQCMKCGRDVEPGQVFCDKCRETMERYPVKPGIVVQLPRRVESAAKKPTVRRRNTPTPEEQNQTLRRTVRWLATMIVLLTVAVIGLGWLSVRLYRESEIKMLPGQNYYSAASAQETRTPTEVPTQSAEE